MDTYLVQGDFVKLLCFATTCCSASRKEYGKKIVNLKHVFELFFNNFPYDWLNNI